MIQSKTILSFFFQIFLFFNLVSANVFSQNSDDSWLGWRGLSKEGKNENAVTPTNWTLNENVAWKTPIHGKGHSSPVVSDKHIFVTTAYNTEKYVFLKGIIKNITLGLVLCLLVLFIYFIFRLIYKKHEITNLNLLNIWGFSFIFGFVIYFSLTDIFFHIEDNTDHITQTSRWFFSGMIVSLCIILATYTITLTLRIRFFLIIILILFSLFILFLRPEPEYYKLTKNNFLFDISYKAGIIPLIVSAIIFVTLFFNKRNLSTNYSNTTLKKTPVRTSFLLVFGATITLIIGIYGIGIYRIIRYSDPLEDFTLPSLDLYFRDSNVFMAFVFFSIAVWALFYISNIFKPQLKKSNWFALILIVLATLVFVNKNYLVGTQEYTRAVVCLDRHSGKINWIREAFSGNQSTLHPENSPASPTPIINDKFIYAYFGTPGLLCLDMTGNIIWENTELPFEDIHGIAASPVFCNGSIIILNDMPKAPYITAIDSKTGKSVWKTNRKPWLKHHSAYRTPTLKKVNGKEIIITWGMYGVNAYDVNSGKELFDYPLNNSNGQLVASIISNNDTLFVPDRNKFYAFSCLKLLSHEEPEIWMTRMKCKGPICSSPVYYNNMLFMISDNGFINCLDATNGKILWSKQLNGIYMSSCNLIGKYIYFSNISGLTTVIAAQNTFNLISENKLPEPIYASMAPTLNELFIRTTEHVWCIKKK